MSYQYYSPEQNKRRSQNMETASFFLGLIAIASSCTVYTSLICGALSIVLALLSRGGEMTLTPKAKVGLIMGMIGLILVVFMFVYTIVFANMYYGGIEEMLREVYGSLGIDYDALIGAY